MSWRRIWIGYANSTQIASIDVRFGCPDGAFAFRERSDTWGADGGDSDGARVIWDGADAKLRACQSGYTFKGKWCQGKQFACRCKRFGDCGRSEDQQFNRIGACGKQERAVVDRGRPNTFDIVTGAFVVDDSVGALARSVSLSASGAG